MKKYQVIYAERRAVLDSMSKQESDRIKGIEEILKLTDSADYHDMAIALYTKGYHLCGWRWLGDKLYGEIKSILKANSVVEKLYQIEVNAERDRAKTSIARVGVMK